MVFSSKCIALAIALTTARNPVAVSAYERASELVRNNEHAAAVAELDVASRLEPSWPDPVRMRAEIFETLAARHRPSATFTAARADELERLATLAPDQASARQAEIDRLRAQSKDAATIEHKRRKLVTPAIIFGTIAAGVFLSGAILYSMTTREFLEPTAYRQYRRDRAGITLMAAGGVLLVPAVVIGVLAGKQARNDAATRAFAVETDRKRPVVAMAPQFFRGGGGLGFHLRF